MESHDINTKLNKIIKILTIQTKRIEQLEQTIQIINANNLKGNNYDKILYNNNIIFENNKLKSIYIIVSDILLNYFNNYEFAKYVIDNIDNIYYELKCTNKFIDHNSTTLLNLICYYSTFEIFEYMIEKNINFEYADSYGRKPIHVLCHHGSLQKLELLIKSGIKLESKSIIINNLFFHNLLNNKFAKFIIDSIDNIYYEIKCTNKFIDRNSTTLLNLICYYSTLEIFEYMIEKNVNFEYADSYGKKPAHILCYSGSLQKLELLIKLGINFACIDIQNKKPIGYVSESNIFKIIKLLLNQNNGLSTLYNDGIYANTFIIKNIDIINYIEEYIAICNSRRPTYIYDDDESINKNTEPSAPIYDSNEYSASILDQNSIENINNEPILVQAVITKFTDNEKISIIAKQV